jgi:hypothetical protein
VGGLLVISLYLLNALQLTRLIDLLTQNYFQFVLCCLLLLYVSSAQMLVALSTPGESLGAFWLWSLFSMILFWLPVFFTSTAEKFGVYVQVLPTTYWLSNAFMLVLLALPWLFLLLNFLRSMAPTRTMLTGFVAGVVSANLTALLFLLSSKEQFVNFYIFSTSAGMAVLSVIGALIGSRLLRW